MNILKLNKMNKYHICYLLKEELCSGINVQAPSYMDALKTFEKNKGKKHIVYISILA
jgi:hypothetical protein